ncbi:uncharacterized protein LOC123672444 isoform X1 [Harmonia axyridis]|uniref:uncharacterized protein LOC123672444 isoform X1 n=1 Tax=Harmonia axyridis TaxID=115357 RepID=UPI001E276EE1|nr:uncharacterized protein LOC123672444 isoform X1 [Harmonia axyridis]
MSDLRCFSREFLYEFIDLYKQFPCLWQVKNRDYSDRHKKNAAYKKMIKKVREVDKKATREKVIKKINTIRGCFRREHNKVLSSLKSGSGTDNVYQPNLWYYKLLLFVLEEPKPGKSESHLQNTDGDDMLDDIENQESTETNTEEIILPDSPSSVQSFKRSEPSSISQAPKRITISRNTPLGFYVDESRESLKKTVNTNNYRSDDQYDAFAKHISAQLRELPIRSFIILQGQIQDLINRERLAQLLPQQDMQQQYDCIPSTSHSDSLEFSQELKEEITIEYDI